MPNPQEERANEMISGLTSAGNEEAAREKPALGEASFGDDQAPQDPQERAEASPEEGPQEVQAAEPDGQDPAPVDPGEPGDPESEPDGERYVRREEFDRVHQEAVKRRHVVKDLKLQLAEQGRNISEMHEMMVNPPQPPSEEEQAIAADPAVQMIRGDIQQLREDAGLTPDQMAENQNAQRYQNARAQAEQVLTGYINTARERFTQGNPDYEEAVQYSLQKRTQQVVRSGRSQEEAAQIVEREMLDMCARAYDRGEDPAEIAYATAVEDYGWAGNEEADPVPDAVAVQNNNVPRTMDSISRIKAGLSNQSVTAMPGDRGGLKSDVQHSKMTRDQFYNQVSPGERIQILADQNKFEELARTGEITVDWV